MKRIRLILIAAIIAAVLCALDSRLRIARYTIDAEQINQPVRIAFLADLHSCFYGENQSGLVSAIDTNAPDLILLGGDIFEEDLSHENTLCLLGQIAERYPCYYVTGNHEYWSGEALELIRRMRKMGVTVLQGDCATAAVGDVRLQIVGVDDPTDYGAGSIGKEGMLAQLKSGFAAADPALYTILLAHRPELIDIYLPYGADLILSGHAHGGQFRLPLLVNGLWAPDQGWLPEYAGGYYRLDSADFIVSRGLARESTRLPRIFNRPELVIIDLE